ALRCVHIPQARLHVWRPILFIIGVVVEINILSANANRPAQVRSEAVLKPSINVVRTVVPDVALHIGIKHRNSASLDGLVTLVFSLATLISNNTDGWRTERPAAVNVSAMLHAIQHP